eukprot:Phypoly_transcript_14010.p1 GENE.Phypoly_transcript_14010~~Phypoly_transcript_14010.p1  ORF type:complete len:303 (-),score=26.70 Phypoly_transcript_14010:18-926(-)
MHGDTSAPPQDGAKKNRLWLGIKDSIAGTLSGAACLFTGHPFDTIKVRMQTQQGTEGAISTFTRTVRNEGILAVYKGVTSPLVGMMFETAVLFVVYGQLKAILQKDPKVPLTIPQLSIAGGLSGVATSLVLTPVELAKCRLQIQTGKVGDTSAQKYKSPLHCLIVTFREEGIRGCFRGLGPTLAREAPGNVAFFGVYEWCKRALTPEGKTVDQLGLGSLVLSGGLGGVAYWSVFYPADVAKSRIQTMDKQIGFFTCLKQIYQTEGRRGLYRGYIPTVIRAFPANAVMFSSYEMISRLLSKLG